MKPLEIKDVKLGMKVKAINSYSGRLEVGEVYTVIEVFNEDGTITVRDKYGVNMVPAYAYRFTKVYSTYLSNQGTKINV